MGKEVEIKHEGGEIVLLEPKQVMAAVVIAEGGSYKAAARAAGGNTHENTVRNWEKNNPEFKREVELRTRESADRLAKLAVHARLDIMKLATQVGETLAEALEALNAKENPDWQTRLKAAELITKHGLPMHPDGDEARSGPQQAVIVITGQDVAAAEKITDQYIETTVVEKEE